MNTHHGRKRKYKITCSWRALQQKVHSKAEAGSQPASQQDASQKGLREGSVYSPCMPETWGEKQKTETCMPTTLDPFTFSCPQHRLQGRRPCLLCPTPVPSPLLNKPHRPAMPHYRQSPCTLRQERATCPDTLHQHNPISTSTLCLALRHKAPHRQRPQSCMIAAPSFDLPSAPILTLPSVLPFPAWRTSGFWRVLFIIISGAGPPIRASKARL